MKMPKQSQPVIKSRTATYHGDVNASILPCPLCLQTCNALSPAAKQMCITACKETFCS